MASNPTTFAGAAELDLSTWNFWWDLNKAAYLDLKSHVHSSGVVTGTGGGTLVDPESASPTSLRPTQKQVREQVVPALLKVLAKEDYNELISSALIALAKVGSEDSAGDPMRFQSAMAPFLADANQEVRESAALSFGILASPSSITTLANLLWDTEAGRDLVKKHEVDYRTRSFAAYGLGLVGARTTSEVDRRVIVAALTRTLERDRTSTPDIGVACLVALSIVPLATLGPVEPVDAGRGRADPPERSRQAQLSYLLALLSDRECHERIRAQCPIALARLVSGLPADRGEPLRARIAGELSALLERNRERPELLQSCILALGEMGTDDGENPLDVRIRSALEHAFAQASDAQSRGFALIAMARAGGRPGAGPSHAGMDDAAKFLTRQLSEGKSMVRPWAGLACGVLGHELVRRSVELSALERLRLALRSALEDERDPAKLGAYAIGAGLVRDGVSGPLLLAHLAETLPDDARGHVAIGLALLGLEEAREPLRKIASESTYRPELLRDCAIALGVLGDKDVAPLLSRMMERGSVATLSAVSTALAYVGDQRSIDPLLAALFHPERTDLARAFAAVALGNAADKESLPWNAKIAAGLNYRAETPTLTDPIGGGGVLNIF